MIVDTALDTVDGWQHVVDAALTTWGRIDGLVHCAGRLCPGAFDRLDEDAIGRSMRDNLYSVIHGVRRVLPVMRRQRSGRIVIVGSLASVIPVPHEVVYSAAKHAVRGLCLALREELRGTGIEVTHIAPGGVDTRMLRLESHDASSTHVFATAPLDPDEVAKVAVDALATPRAEIVLPRIAAVSTVLGVWPRLCAIGYPILDFIGRRRRAGYVRRATTPSDPASLIADEFGILQ